MKTYLLRIYHIGDDSGFFCKFSTAYERKAKTEADIRASGLCTDVRIDVVEIDAGTLDIDVIASFEGLKEC